MAKILLIDDDVKSLKIVGRTLRMIGYETIEVSNSMVTIETALRENPDVIIVDLMMPGLSGLDILDRMRETALNIPAIVLTGYGTVKTAVEAMKKGAFDYVTKPYNIDEIGLIIRRALEQNKLIQENKMLKEKLLEASQFGNLITQDLVMKKLLREVQTLSNTDTTVLITGESGTGKEKFAKAIHEAGVRRDRPFIIIDCGGLPETILESEVFGHVKGSFTGAISDKKGFLEIAQNGTVFFDEISELPYALQKKLLRVIQEKEFSKVGDTRTIKADIRILAATNRPLKKWMEQGKFREDLFYRLNVVCLTLPPLRQRTMDIPLLAYHFISEFNIRLGKRVTHIHDGAMAAMMTYAWPGNVRELRNIIERIMVFKVDDSVVLDDFPEEIKGTVGTNPALLRPLKEVKGEQAGAVEKEHMRMLLALCKGNVSRAAGKAQMDRSNFRKLMKRYNIVATDYRGLET